MVIRKFEPQRDREAVHRIWRECGWIDAGHEHELDLYMTESRAWVGELNGEAECLVLNDSGTMRYLDADIPISCVTGVTTATVARRQGLAGRALARSLAEEAERGAVVSTLGAFEQGFYNRLGYGTGAYDHFLHFDPADLRIPGRITRPPCRLTTDNWHEAHTARLNRHRPHGAINLFSESNTRAEMKEGGNRFGLGYRDSSGTLTHYVWLQAKHRESGPYKVSWIVYQTREQLLELLHVLASLGDQVPLIQMVEPADVQLQDLLTQPFRKREISANGKYPSSMKAKSWFQARILDLPAALARTHLSCRDVRFNLKLTDPITGFLEGSTAWRGIEGTYIVSLGSDSRGEPGMESSVPTLEASVGAFTRLWLGVRPATGLAVTDGLSGPSELLNALDHALRLPQPHPDWDF